MSNAFLPMLILLMTGCASGAGVAAPTAPAAPDATLERRFPGLPVDAARVVQKLAACAHFAGEFGGDNSTRDREVTAAIVQLQCETIDQEVAAMLDKYGNDRAVIEALKLASEL